MIMCSRKRLAVPLVLLFAVAPSPAVAETHLGPSPYESFAGDSPFAGLTFSSYFHLENFEDHLFNTPGVDVICTEPPQECGVTSVICFCPTCHDSVDEDDLVLDGNGSKGDSFFVGPAHLGITFTFDASVLGTLPTHVGIVWTDGPPGETVIFRAFGPGGFDDKLFSVNATGFADGEVCGVGGTAEDRFFGVINPGGISAISLFGALAKGMELDHLQYGADCPADINADGTVNVIDLVRLLLCFGLPAVPGCEDEDVNLDGTVNVLDLIDVLLAFGTACP